MACIANHLSLFRLAYFFLVSCIMQKNIFIKQFHLAYQSYSYHTSHHWDIQIMYKNVHFTATKYKMYIKFILTYG